MILILIHEPIRFPRPPYVFDGTTPYHQFNDEGCFADISAFDPDPLTREIVVNITVQLLMRHHQHMSLLL